MDDNLPVTTPATTLREAPCVGPIAQLVEQLTFNQWVTGSNPVGLTTVFILSFLFMVLCTCFVQRAKVLDIVFWQERERVGC